MRVESHDAAGSILVLSTCPHLPEEDILLFRVSPFPNMDAIRKGQCYIVPPILRRYKSPIDHPHEHTQGYRQPPNHHIHTRLDIGHLRVPWFYIPNLHTLLQSCFWHTKSSFYPWRLYTPPHLFHKRSRFSHHTVRTRNLQSLCTPIDVYPICFS